MNKQILSKLFLKAIIAIIALAAISGGSVAVGRYVFAPATVGVADDLRLDDQEATIRAVNKVMPAVVSIIVYDYNETVIVSTPAAGVESMEKVRNQIARGTGFLISADGYILTNKHLAGAAEKKTGEYRVILNSGKEYYAQLIGLDPVYDLAVLKIFDKDLPYVELGDSDKLSVGATVIAIGNALGRYQNSATKGIVSGLGRSLVVNEYTTNPILFDNVIQTDAEINVGNSGGPLVDLAGRVVGINSAIEQSGTAIGFAIPVNDARPTIRSIKERGRIVRPKMGVLYRMITPELAIDQSLSRDRGAWILREAGDTPSVLPDSPAEKAGLDPGDIVFEVNAIKIEGRNTLQSIVQKYKPGDKIGLKVQRGGKVLIKTVTLEEFK